MVLVFLNFFFLSKSKLFSIVAVPIYIPINKIEGFLFSHPLQIGKQEVKLYANDMILCIGKPKDSTRKLLELIN